MDCDYLGQSSIRKRKSSSSPDYPSRRPTEERRRSRYRSPSRSVKSRRRYHDAQNRYPSTPSPERRRRCDRHASRLSPDRRRRYDRNASRESVERRRYRCPSSRQAKEREYVSLNHPYERRSGCDSISVPKTREEMISRDISSNFCFGTSRKTSTSSTYLDVGSLSSLTDKQDDSVATWVGSFPGFVSEDLVIEILSRLPVESLMRFKSVCKHWCTLIKHDRRFIDLHHNNRIKSHPNLLFISGINPREQPIYPDEEELEDNVQQVDDEEEQEEEDNGEQLVDVTYSKVPQQILFADVVQGSSGNCEEVIPRAIMTDDKWFHYEHVLGLVNGLACFLDFDEDGVKLYNVSTREASPWIKTTLLSQEEDKLSRKDLRLINREAIYRFGFDPEKKEHKVFCFCRLSDYSTAKPSSISNSCPDYTRCEVLAVGRDTKWRRINVVPNENNQININKVFPSFEENKRDPVYANGTIYWRNDGSCKKGLKTKYFDDPDVIVALDVASEKFRVIPIPNFILDETNVYGKDTTLFMLRGRVAVIYWLSDNTVKLWMLDDGADKKLENCQGSERNWISETITLPYGHCPTRHIDFHGVADQLVLFIYSQDHSVYKNFGFLHFYDRSKKTFKKIEIDGFSSVTFFRNTSLITTFTGSLFPVQPQKD